MRFAVVGHVEWVEFAKVERVPEPGEIFQASDWWAEAAGGGGVASVRLARRDQRPVPDRRHAPATASA